MPGVTHVPPPKVTGFLIRVPTRAAAAFATAAPSLKISGTPITFEPLFPIELAGVGLAAAGAPRWYLARTGKAFAQANPWDLIHQELAGRDAELGLGAGADALFIEPDLEQQFQRFHRAKAILRRTASAVVLIPRIRIFLLAPDSPGF